MLPTLLDTRHLVMDGLGRGADPCKEQRGGRRVAREVKGRGAGAFIPHAKRRGCSGSAPCHQSTKEVIVNYSFGWLSHPDDHRFTNVEILKFTVPGIIKPTPIYYIHYPCYLVLILTYSLHSLHPLHPCNYYHFRPFASQPPWIFSPHSFSPPLALCH